MKLMKNVLPARNGAGESTVKRSAPGDGADPADPVVSIQNLVKRFRRESTSVTALDTVSLDVHAGEFLVLLGPSGCGKTTLLRTIAGLERPESGHIQINGRMVFSAARGINLPPEHRRLGMVFQSYALWPHLTVLENVAYPLLARSRGRAQKAAARGRAREALALVGIPELAGQFPHQMSGGQQQRVALARALVADNNLLLFDEPLSNVDAKLRAKLRSELVSMQHKLGFCAIYVTHDQDEAMAMAERLAVMRHGKVVQLGTPRELYESPTSRYVSDFIGSSNEVPGVVTAIESAIVIVRTAIGPIRGVDGCGGLSVGDDVVATWRPELSTLLDRHSAASANCWTASLEGSLFLGSYTEHELRVGGQELRLWTTTSEPPDADGLRLAVDPQRVRILPAT